jgi:hypothetical protein
LRWTLRFSRKHRFTRNESRALSSRRVAPSSEFDRAVLPLPLGSCDLAGNSASHGILRPFDAWSIGGATSPELTSLRLLRSQGFSPSQRLAPRRTFRPCFMPVTSWGFLPSELSPLEEPYRLSAAFALLVFSSHPRYHTTRPCHAKRAEARCSHPDVLWAVSAWSILQRPTTCRLGAPCSGTCRQKLRACARRLLWPTPRAPHGRPGLLPLARGAETPPVRDPRPRRSQHLDHPDVRPPAGRSPRSAAHLGRSNRWATLRLSPVHHHAEARS